MDISTSNRPLPPIPNKPVPVREALETLESQTDALDQFKAVEQAAETHLAKSFANADDDAIKAEAQRLIESKATLSVLEERSQVRETKSAITSDDIMQRYQAAEVGSNERASHHLDEVV